MLNQVQHDRTLRLRSATVTRSAKLTLRQGIGCPFSSRMTTVPSRLVPCHGPECRRANTKTQASNTRLHPSAIREFCIIFVSLNIVTKAPKPRESKEPSAQFLRGEKQVSAKYSAKYRILPGAPYANATPRRSLLPCRHVSVSSRVPVALCRNWRTAGPGRRYDAGRKP